MEEQSPGYNAHQNQPSPRRRAKSWRTLFAESSTAVFVIGKSRRLLFANQAWERVTGKVWSNVRGMKLSRYRSGSLLGRVLMPPAEALEGQIVSVRRALPGEAHGPPWWDITFVPLASQIETNPLAIVGYLRVIGERLPRKSGGKVDPKLAEYRELIASKFHIDAIVGESIIAEQLRDYLRLAASVRNPVKLVGEAGSGKATVARVIHYSQSEAYARRPFVKIDCVGLQPYLIDALLFGKGGIFAIAGSIYLADPGSLPRELQEKLVASFDRPRPPRLLWGTTLERDERLLPVFEERFAIPMVPIAPLKNRLDDLPLLCSQFVPSGIAISEDAIRLLKSHEWPGNLREFYTTLHTAISRLAPGEAILKPVHFPRHLQERLLISDHPILKPGKPLALPELLATIEQRMIDAALQAEAGSVTTAAKRLGLSRAALHRKLEQLRGSARSQEPS